MAKNTGTVVYHLFFGVLTLVAVGCQLGVQLDYGGGIINFFSFFTNLSNIYAAVMFLVVVWYRLAGKKLGPKLEIARGTSVVCMVIVGVVFSVLLRDVDLGHLMPWVNAVVHYAMPLAALLSWLWWPPRARLSARSIVYWLVFPAAYLVYVLLRGAATGWYPYPFLTPSKVGGYAGVAGYAVGILALFLAASWVLLRWAKRRTI